MIEWREKSAITSDQLKLWVFHRFSNPKIIAHAIHDEFIVMI